MLKSKFSKINFPKLLLKTLSVINKKGKTKLLYLILIVFVQAFFDVLSLASLMPLIQVITDKESLKTYTQNLISALNIDLVSNDISLSIYIPLFVILIMIISTIIRLYVVFKTNKFIEETRHSISTRLLEGYINSEINLNLNSSEIAKQILSEVDQFIIIVFQPTMLFLTNILVLAAIILYLLFSNFTASLVSLFLLLTFYANFYLFSKRKLNFEGYKSEKANKGRFQTAIESFQLIKDIKIYSAEQYFSNRFKYFSKIFANTNSTYSTLVASPKYILEMLVFIALAFSILLISLSNIETTNSLPLLGIFAFAAYKAQPALSNVIYGINSIEYGSKIITNLYLSLKKSNSTSYEKIKSIDNINNKDRISKRNNLVIRDLKYIYDKNNKGINNINLNIEVPSLFILVGPSGSGKSTLLNLISGNLNPQQGEVFLSKNIYKRPPKISFLHQEFELYDVSIAENIAFGIKKENINYQKLKDVLIKAEIYNYVQSLNKKFNTRVGENGSNLSIGQKQRIAFARALYFEPDILLLDEPTSALDIINEEKIIKTIINLSKEIIVIMATHKLKFLPENTRVGFLDKRGLRVKLLKDYKKN